MTMWLLLLCAHVCARWQTEGCGCFPVTEKTFSCDARSAFKAEIASRCTHHIYPAVLDMKVALVQTLMV